MICFLWLLIFNCPIPILAQQNCNIEIKGIVQQPSCSGGMDGAIQVQLTGGVAPYTYFWSNGMDSKDISSLAAGEYTLTVRDSKGCTAKAVLNLIDEKVELGLLVEQRQVSNDRYVVTVNFKGDKKPYAITIKNLSEGFRTPQVEYKGQALRKGIYLLEAFTEAGCSVMQKVTIGANESSIR